MLAIHCHGDMNNPALVMLHGFLGDGNDWADVIPFLLDDFYCITVDLPGHGKSGNVVLDSAGLKQCAQHIKATLDFAKIKSFHLLGYSLGGRIALQFAQLFPQSLLSLQLESCHPGLEGDADKQARIINDKKWSTLFTQLPLAEVLSLWYQQPVFAELSLTARQQLIEKRSQQSIIGLLACYQFTGLGLQQNMWQLPTQLTCDCYYYYGENDLKFTALAEKWQTVAQLQLCQIKRAGHNVHAAQPALFASRLSTNLKIGFEHDEC